jgi:signal transduction histidine kinase
MTVPGKLPPAAVPEATREHFAVRVAHDFNNLLTAILGNLELLQLRVARNNLPGLDGYLDGANSAGTRAVAFAHRLMQYSGHGGAEPVPVPVDTVLSHFAPETTCRLAAGATAVLCDPAQLELAMGELLDNAKAAGGEVFLTSAVSAGKVTIVVRDTGKGMDAETLAHATEPFFTTASNGTGRGLGLAIAERVIRELGGSMKIEAEPGAGCTVTVVLPVA